MTQRRLTDRELLAGLGLEIQGLQKTVGKVEDTLAKQDQVLWKGGNGVPAVVPSLKTVLLLLKITVGIGATVAAAVVLQAIQQYDLLSTQQDIRRFTVEAARSASEAKIQSEKNNLILEEKVVPKVGP